MGHLSAETMVFNTGFKSQIAHYVEKHHEEVADSFDEKYTQLFREHPARNEFDAQTIAQELLNDEGLMRYFR